MFRYSKEERIRIVQVYTRTMSITEVQCDYRIHFRKRISPAKNTIKSLIRKFTSTGNVVDKPRSERLKLTRSDAVIDQVATDVADNPATSIRKRSTQLSISRLSLHAF